MEKSKFSAANRVQKVLMIAVRQFMILISGLGIRAEHPAPKLGLLFQLFCESSSLASTAPPTLHDVSATGCPIERPGEVAGVFSRAGERHRMNRMHVHRHVDARRKGSSKQESQPCRGRNGGEITFQGGMEEPR